MCQYEDQIDLQTNMTIRGGNIILMNATNHWVPRDWEGEVAFESVTLSENRKDGFELEMRN